jgi:long-chain acyl-CoA synthetase
MVVGDNRPFIAALITIDPEAFPAWKKQNGKPDSATIAELANDSALVATIQEAVDVGNKAVSNAEAIKKFKILTIDWTEDGGQMTPSMKMKRNVIAKECEADIAELYGD